MVWHLFSVEKPDYRCSESTLHTIRSILNEQAVNPLQFTIFRDTR